MSYLKGRTGTMLRWEQIKGYNISVLFEDPDIEVMQFTGLKDKHGKEIYEGDVCRWPSGIDRQIIWDRRNACFSTPLHTLQVERGQSTVIGHHLEVIGNIYENAGLLNAQDAGNHPPHP